MSAARAETNVIPLNFTNGWQFLKFSAIPPNRFCCTSAGLEIGVTNSAAPAIFPLTNGVRVTALRASGKITGSLKLPAARQGEKGADDYTVRIGLVEHGSRRLGEFESMFSPDWIKKLFSLAPPGSGISKIHFSNVGTDVRQLKRTRTHPLSDLMEETVVAVPDSNGFFSFTNRFDRPINVVAVWIACDGDDTKSSFAVLLNKVELDRQSPLTETGKPGKTRSRRSPDRR